MSYGLAQARYASDAATDRVARAPADDDLRPPRRRPRRRARRDAPQGLGDQRHRGSRTRCEILLELHATLDTPVWPDGEGLAQLYLWIVGELMQARLRQAPQRVADCRDLVVPLRDAWGQAVRQLAGEQGADDAGAQAPGAA